MVLVTDIMSWVTREVKKSAARESRDQTPVMRTSGVFPVAQLIGGEGVAKGLGGIAPDPLADLPPAGTTATSPYSARAADGSPATSPRSPSIASRGARRRRPVASAGWFRVRETGPESTRNARPPRCRADWTEPPRR